MTKALYFTAHAGVSGDMALGALIDLGADLGQIQSALSGLSFASEFRIEASRDHRRGVAGTRARVILADDASRPHRTWADVQKIIADAPLPPQVRTR
ncbi:MAG: nickel insertion protein, partial [Pseudomonadota bacterium]